MYSVHRHARWPNQGSHVSTAIECICVYIHVHVCMYVCECMCVYVRMRLCMSDAGVPWRGRLAVAHRAQSRRRRKWHKGCLRHPQAPHRPLPNGPPISLSLSSIQYYANSICLSACLPVCLYERVCECVCLFVCVYSVYICWCVYAHTLTVTLTNTHTHTHKHTRSLSASLSQDCAYAE
jgi:hypothetical protein